MKDNDSQKSKHDMDSRYIGVSTSWLGDIPHKSEDILKRIGEVEGINGVEINYRITLDAFAPIVKNMAKMGLTIFSLHNFTPLPPDIPFHKASGDVYNLASPDPDERKLAILWTLRTIEWAHELEGPTVILHCGKIEMETEWELIRKWVELNKIKSDDARVFINRKIKERNKISGPYWDALLMSLDDLANKAQKYSVTLGIENRYSYHEIPQEEELVTIFSEFQGAPLVYWHDIGHFIVNIYLGIIDPKTYYGRVFRYLGGCHIHDVSGINDHLPLGDGDIEYEELNNNLRFGFEVPLILELKAGTPDEKVSESIQKIRKSLETITELK